MIHAQPKPTPKRKLKARAQRAESAVQQQVRAEVVARDGDCRLFDPSLWLIFGCCGGEAEFAHLGAQRRFKTRGMSPEQRHQTPGAIMLCTLHHQAYDGHKMQIQPATSRGADGPLGFQIRDTVYVEPENRSKA